MHFALRTGLCSVLGAALCACSTLGLDKEKPKTPTVGNRTPILSRISDELKPDPTLASVSVVLPPATTNPDWPQAGGNAAKSIGHLTLGAAPARAWMASIAGDTSARRLAAAPVIGNGTLFVVDSDGTVQAIDTAAGGRRWSHPIAVERDLRAANFGGGVSYNEGRVYATAGTGDVLALNAADGSEIWRVKPAGPLRGAPTIAFNALYVMTQDNQILALSLADGSVIWQDSGAPGQTGVFGVGAPAAAQGTVVAGYSTGEVVAYRYENGRNVWGDNLGRISISTQVGTLTDVDADPIIDNGRVYALGQGGIMAAYELTTGQRIWDQPLAGISTPTVSGEWLFTLTDDSRLLAIARSTGRIKWITQLQQWRNPNSKTTPVFWTGPVLGGNRLWVASSQGDIQWVDVNTGAASPFTKLSSGVTQPPVIADNTLYILEESGRISAWR